MLHAAPTSETKTDTPQGKTPVVPQPERELHPHLLSPAGLYSPGGMSGIASGTSPDVQRRQAFAGMQNTHGNQAVLRILHGPQQVARMPMLRPSQGVMLQRKCDCGGSSEAAGECAECKAKDEGTMQRAAVSAAPTNSVPPIVHDVLRSSGRPLDVGTRAFMEPRFGHDFSGVRVHTDAKAAQSARAVNAVAYTVGKDVVFGAGQYAPGTSEGRRLIAHELTHTIQQGEGGKGIQGKLEITDPSNTAEQEAQIASDAVMQDQSVISTINENTQVARQDAGPVNTPQDAGLPDVVPAPPPPVPGPVGPPPVATPPIITDLTVANQPTAIAYEEPGPGGPHFVTVAGQTGDENVIVEATTDRPLNPGETINWGSDPAIGGTIDPGNPSRMLVSRRRATRVRVTATSGGTSLSLTVWAIFARVREASGPNLGFSPPAPPPPGSACAGLPGTFCVFATVDFDAEIFPKSLTTEVNRPNFARGPIPPPGGVNPCGLPLAGGVTDRFDMSRQSASAVIDPAGFVANPGLCIFSPHPFPGDNAVGNDDVGTGDEKDDPFVAGNIPLNGRAVANGFIGSTDVPSINIPHALGAVGDTIDIRFNLREFARLDYHLTWWLISNRLPWFVHFLLQKNAANLWVDNGSTAG
jgi:Domain of unknown function (DUF4157)